LCFQQRITAPSPCSIHGLIRVSNGNPIYKAGSFSHFQLLKFDSSNGDKLNNSGGKVDWGERGGLILTNPERSGCCISETVNRLHWILGPTTPYKFLRLLHPELGTGRLLRSETKGAFTFADAEMGYRAN